MMSKWGCIHDDDGDYYHIVPVSEEGYVLPPHEIALHCRCRIRFDEQERSLVIHTDPKRGGANS